MKHYSTHSEIDSNGCSLQAVAEGILQREGPSMPVSASPLSSVDTQWRVRVSPIRVFVFAGRGVPLCAAPADDAGGARRGGAPEAAGEAREF